MTCHSPNGVAFVAPGFIDQLLFLLLGLVNLIDDACTASGGLMFFNCA
jgi:hypothetical protein